MSIQSVEEYQHSLAMLIDYYTIHFYNMSQSDMNNMEKLEKDIADWLVRKGRDDARV